ncbi:hypothetical protein BDZ91DRAFT_150708 [Kalaharituber pfeilii]|nr:hypothetical protein BDZ91DRAFT_150708 [Kalaharituber pfeilii]
MSLILDRSADNQTCPDHFDHSRSKTPSATTPLARLSSLGGSCSPYLYPPSPAPSPPGSPESGSPSREQVRTTLVSRPAESTKRPCVVAEPETAAPQATHKRRRLSPNTAIMVISSEGEEPPRHVNMSCRFNKAALNGERQISSGRLEPDVASVAATTGQYALSREGNGSTHELDRQTDAVSSNGHVQNGLANGTKTMFPISHKKREPSMESYSPINENVRATNGFTPSAAMPKSVLKRHFYVCPLTGEERIMERVVYPADSRSPLERSQSVPDPSPPLEFKPRHGSVMSSGSGTISSSGGPSSWSQHAVRPASGSSNTYGEAHGELRVLAQKSAPHQHEPIPAHHELQVSEGPKVEPQTLDFPSEGLTNPKPTIANFCMPANNMDVSIDLCESPAPMSEHSMDCDTSVHGVEVGENFISSKGTGLEAMEAREAENLRLTSFPQPQGPQAPELENNRGHSPWPQESALNLSEPDRMDVELDQHPIQQAGECTKYETSSEVDHPTENPSSHEPVGTPKLDASTEPKSPMKTPRRADLPLSALAGNFATAASSRVRRQVTIPSPVTPTLPATSQKHRPAKSVPGTPTSGSHSSSMNDPLRRMPVSRENSNQSKRSMSPGAIEYAELGGWKLEDQDPRRCPGMWLPFVPREISDSIMQSYEDAYRQTHGGAAPPQRRRRKVTGWWRLPVDSDREDLQDWIVVTTERNYWEYDEVDEEGESTDEESMSDAVDATGLVTRVDIPGYDSDDSGRQWWNRGKVEQSRGQSPEGL